MPPTFHYHLFIAEQDRDLARKKLHTKARRPWRHQREASGGQRPNKTAPSNPGVCAVSLADSKETLLCSQQVCHGPPLSPPVCRSTSPVPSVIPVHPRAGKFIDLALKLNSAHLSKQSLREETLVYICKSLVIPSPAANFV